MLKFYLTSFIACFLALNGFAQKQNVYFLKNDGQEVKLKDSADFIRIVREPDSGTVLYNVLEYYLNGNTKLIGKSSAVEPVKLEGTVISYYPNKKKKCVANYQKGKLSGFVYDYFPNGKLYRSVEYQPEGREFNNLANAHFLTSAETVQAVYDSTGVKLVENGNGHYPIFDADYNQILEDGNVKNGKRNGTWKGFSNQGKILFTEEWADGKFVKGVRTDDKSDTIKYTVKEALPTYEGGDEGFGRYLAQTLRYPKIARDQNLQGTLIASFVIDRTGNVSAIRILKSLSNETEAEVIRTFKAAKKWKPGIQNGATVSMEATVAVTFMLPNPSMGNILIDKISWNLPKNP